VELFSIHVSSSATCTLTISRLVNGNVEDRFWNESSDGTVSESFAQYTRVSSILLSPRYDGPRRERVMIKASPADQTLKKAPVKALDSARERDREKGRSGTEGPAGLAPGFEAVRPYRPRRIAAIAVTQNENWDLTGGAYSVVEARRIQFNAPNDPREVRWL